MTLKPGYKTTEFLIVVLTIIGQVIAGAADWIPTRYAALGAMVSAAAYAVARGLAKQGTVSVPPAPPAPPVAPPAPPAV